MNRKILYGIIGAALIVLPFLVTNYWVFLLTDVFIMALFATSFNLLLGYTGLVSFGQAAYYAVGAYGTALMIKYFSSSLWPAIGVGVGAALVLALVIGYLCVRVTRLYFSMLTLAFSSMIYAIIFKWRGFTGGDDGIAGVARPSLDFFFIKFSLDNPKAYYFFVLVLVALSVWVLWRIVRSPLGYLLQANRDNAKRAEFIGVAVKRFRLIAFMIAGFFAGLAGSLYALLAGFVSPELAFWTKSGDPVIMSLVGGFNTFLGPVVGAAIYSLLKDFIATKTENWLFYLGLILLVLVLALPQGVMGGIQRRRGKV